MLETRFPRFPGDLGYAGTWDFPVHYRVVHGATANKAINQDPAQALIEEHPDVAAIVLECTNMVPYAADIQAHTGRPVYSIFTLINWFQSGLMAKHFH